MKTIIRNPSSGVYPTTGDYVHALEVQGPQRFLFVSGTMGLDQHGVPGKTLDEQLTLLWSNIRTILATADMSVDNIVRLTSYLTDPSVRGDKSKRPCGRTWRSGHSDNRNCGSHAGVDVAG